MPRFVLNLPRVRIWVGQSGAARCHAATVHRGGVLSFESSATVWTMEEQEARTNHARVLVIRSRARLSFRRDSARDVQLPCHRLMNAPVNLGRS